MANALEEAKDFVREALSKGKNRNEIEAALLEAGWPKVQVTRALSAYADSPFAIPVPRPQTQVSARHAFVYLLMFMLLLIVSVQFGNLVFQLINAAVPEPLESDYAPRVRADSIRWAVASLVVAFPLFALISRSTAKEIRINPAMRLSPVRRWLTYIALFVAATVLIGDLISLIYNFLAGDLSMRFLLKSLTVGAIAGGIFTFYFFGLSREEVSPGDDSK